MSLSERYASTGSNSPLLLVNFLLQTVSERTRGFSAALRRMSSEIISATCDWMNRSISSSDVPMEFTWSSTFSYTPIAS